MGYVKRAQLLDGNWKVRPAAGKVFNTASFGDGADRAARWDGSALLRLRSDREEA